MMHLKGPLAERDNWQATGCSIAKAVDLIGTRSAILILREAFYGATRFDQFSRRVGVTDAVASARLKELTEAGIFVKVPYRDAGQRERHEYRLTDMGRDLFPVVMSLMEWGNKHLQPDGAPLTLTDRSRHPVHVGVVADPSTMLAPEDVEVRITRPR
ncbi:winged helix-turn-helix transcriptional regulator [Gordonia terrae]|uniref:winged helix-turn-helix transcriptional regulator n=1 Tax=Gordonia terrae TaxID=2055 RepID=UPI003F6A6E9B